MALPPTPELARRIRAAAAYSDEGSLERFRERVEISHGSLYRVLKGERPLKESEWRQMAAIAGLPMGFFTGDFAALNQQPAAAVPQPEVVRAPKLRRPASTPQEKPGPRRRREGS